MKKTFRSVLALVTASAIVIGFPLLVMALISVSFRLMCWMVGAPFEAAIQTTAIVVGGAGAIVSAGGALVVLLDGAFADLHKSIQEADFRFRRSTLPQPEVRK